MNNQAAVYFFILIFAKRICSLLNTNHCMTPNGEEATCISIFSCPVITDALALNDPKAISFAQKSQCGYEKVPLVCCGTIGHLIALNVLSIFSKPQSDDDSVALEDFTTNFLPNRTVCGFQKETDRVLGGKVTDIYEFPWMAGLEYKSRVENETAGIRCGGTLINNKYVVTAAHCMDTIEFELIRVWLGDWKLSSDPDCLNFTLGSVCNDPVVKLHIANKIPHSFYSDGQNDIALLELAHSIYFSDYIRPICLPPLNLPYPKVGSRLTVSGWGYTKPGGSSSDLKLKVDVPVISNTNCKNITKKRFVSDNHLCAGGEFGKDACLGDSGGPLMRSYRDAKSNEVQWYLEGIISWGDGCGRHGVPAVYTRMASYLYWVIYAISKEGEVTYSDFDYDSIKNKLLPQRTICGLEKEVIGSAESGNEITNIYEFPWVVGLDYTEDGKSNQFICGGSLITNRFVLTAASCMNTFLYEHIRVWLGDWRISSDPDCTNQTTAKLCNDAVLKLSISKTIMYPYHTSYGINDIALLKLEREVKFTDYIRPICLPPFNFSNPSNGSRLTVSGWGITDEFGEYSDYKMKLNKTLISNSECMELYSNRYNDRIDEVNTFCAGGSHGKDLCKGGGGSPLLKEFEDEQSKQRQWFQVGINAWGLGCGDPGVPTVYTKVSPYMEWILRTISE